MKKFLLLTLMLIPFVSAAQAVPPASSLHTISSTWVAPASWNGSGASVPCSTTVTTFCVVDYSVTITPPSGAPGGSVVVSASGTSNVWTPGGFLYCGTWNVAVAANWKDGSGTLAVSAPLNGTAVVSCPFTASPATGLVNKVS